MRSVPRAVLLLVIAALLAGCASTPPEAPRYATVQSIREIDRPQKGAQAAGAVGGALIGGLIGSNIGGGTGQTIATVVGSVAGGYAGGSIAGKAAREKVYEVTVRYDDGVIGTVVVEEHPKVSIGQRVRVKGGSLEPA